MIERHRQRPRTKVRDAVRVIKKVVGADLMLNTRVLSFRVFTDENGIDIIIWCLVPRDGNAWPNVGEKVESPSEGQIEGNVTLSNCPQQSAHKFISPWIGLTRCSQRTFELDIRNDRSNA